jgi:hypothetical protein
MKPTKKPPPDNVGNVLGRIRALKVVAHQNAAMDEGDPERALARHMKAIEPRLKKLRARLAKVRREAPVPPPDEPKTKATKGRKSKRESQGDILETLGVSVR